MSLAAIGSLATARPGQRPWLSVGAGLAWLLVVAPAGGGGFDRNGAHTLGTEFSGSELVQILGYPGDAMEPFISKDGRFLLFNNLNQPQVNTDLFYAERIDDLTFVFRGEIRGVNTTALEGVASLDRKGFFYFVSTRSYATTQSTLYRGRFSAGDVSEVGLVDYVSREKPGMVMFDAEINASGDSIYLADGDFTVQPAPHSAEIVLATRFGKRFLRSPESAALLANINTAALEYAPDISGDDLELYFTRWDLADPGGVPTIYRSQRASATLPFGPPQRIAAIAGFAEAPSLSADGHSLYYHQWENGRFVIRRTTR